ncbi:MAG: VWA domain-containing protein [Deltaproteobacteria bacterium]|nr:VWA domain-containing protein [Deltaproteobacteria bacterium]
MTPKLLIPLMSLVGLSLGPVAARAQQVEVRSALDHAVLPAHKKQTAYLRVGLRGFTAAGRARAPLNVAIVIDKSGSMSGDKIANAREAAKAAIQQLVDDDIVSVIAFDDTVQVLVPATKVSDRQTILTGISRLTAGGHTALFAGTVKGGAEVRKFLSKERVNRVVLLSDGQANVGPQSASALGQLGATLRKEGVSVTTVGLGLGYNEDLLVQLAQQSGGQHVFIEDHRRLAEIFRQGFGGLASIVAQEVVVKVTLAPDVRPVRVLGRDAEIIGQTVTVQMPELYAGQLDDMVLELEVAASAPQSRRIADVEVSYHNTITRSLDRIAQTVAAEMSEDPARWGASEDREVGVAVAERLANEASRRAIELRDQGKVDEARRLMQESAARLKEGARAFESKTLEDLAKEYDFDAQNVEGPAWERQRKHMTRRNYVSPYQIDQQNF